MFAEEVHGALGNVPGSDGVDFENRHVRLLELQSFCSVSIAWLVECFDLVYGCVGDDCVYVAKYLVCLLKKLNHFGPDRHVAFLEEEIAECSS